MAPGRRITRTRGGRFRLKLPREEREILRSLPQQLREMLGTDHPALRRLFPPAYEDDPARSAEFDRLMREDLLEHHRGNLEVLEATVDAEELDEEQVSAWMGAINDLRLALGTRLEVTEDLYDAGVTEDDPRSPAFALFLYLGWLEEQVVAALLAGVDPAGVPGAPGPPPPPG
jgi:uncharacterized protein DUF2017